MCVCGTHGFSRGRGRLSRPPPLRPQLPAPPHVRVSLPFPLRPLPLPPPVAMCAALMRKLPPVPSAGPAEAAPGPPCPPPPPPPMGNAGCWVPGWFVGTGGRRDPVPIDPARWRKCAPCRFCSPLQFSRFVIFEVFCGFLQPFSFWGFCGVFSGYLLVSFSQN